MDRADYNDFAAIALFGHLLRRQLTGVEDAKLAHFYRANLPPTRLSRLAYESTCPHWRPQYQCDRNERPPSQTYAPFRHACSHRQRTTNARCPSFSMAWAVVCASSDSTRSLTTISAPSCARYNALLANPAPRTGDQGDFSSKTVQGILLFEPYPWPPDLKSKPL